MSIDKIPHKKYFKYCIIFAFYFFLANTKDYSYAQTGNYNWKTLFDQSYYIGFKNFPQLRQSWINLSNSKATDDMQSLSYGMDAILAMFETSEDVTYLDDAILITNNVINRAHVTKNIPGNKFKLKDNYKGWIGEIPNEDMYQQETVLSEIYLFQYVTRLLKDIHNNPGIYSKHKYRKFYKSTLQFVETDVWDKWRERGIRYNGDKFNYILLGRTHMASHWAYIAAELYFLTSNQSRRREYFTLDSLYNNKLENNFKKYEDYISWNQTWDSSINQEEDIIQDVSHGNLVVSYIVEASDLGLWKDTDAIQRLIFTLKEKLWDRKDCSFRDNIDGSMFKKGYKGSVGSFQADGFVKLTRYDQTLFSIYEQFVDCSRFLTSWGQYGQLFANLALSQKLLKTQNK